LLAMVNGPPKPAPPDRWGSPQLSRAVPRILLVQNPGGVGWLVSLNFIEKNWAGFTRPVLELLILISTIITYGVNQLCLVGSRRMGGLPSGSVFQPPKIVPDPILLQFPCWGVAGWCFCGGGCSRRNSVVVFSGSWRLGRFTRFRGPGVRAVLGEWVPRRIPDGPVNPDP